MYYLFIVLEIPYEVTICTGDIRGAGTNSNVFLVLYGDKGKSDEFWLRNNISYIISMYYLFIVLEIPYEVTICTGDIRGAGTNANVFLVLYGDKAKSDEFWLRNKTDNFERGQLDKFKVR